MLLVSYTCFAQQQIIDSLKTILESTKADSSKINTMIELSREYSDMSEYAKSLEYGQKALQLSETCTYKKGQGTSLHVIGNVYNFQGDVNKALEYYLRSVKIKEEIGDKKGLSASLSNIGIVYMDSGNYPKALEYPSRGRTFRPSRAHP